MNQIDKMAAYETPHAAELDAIGRQIGYGRACQILGDLWDQMLERDYGRPSQRGKMERRKDIEAIEAVILARQSDAESESGSGDKANSAPPELPAILFDGHAVYKEVCAARGKRNFYVSTNAVSDTLDAVVRLLRAPSAGSAGTHTKEST